MVEEKVFTVNMRGSTARGGSRAGRQVDQTWPARREPGHRGERWGEQETGPRGSRAKRAGLYRNEKPGERKLGAGEV